MISSGLNYSFIPAVGTVSNKILVWKSSLCSKAEKHCQTQIDYVSPQFQLTGHDGPITRLCWSSYDELLCSSSEDRSVRLWQMNSDPYCKWIGWGKSFTMVYVVLLHVMLTISY